MGWRTGKRKWVGEQVKENGLENGKKKMGWRMGKRKWVEGRVKENGLENG